MKLYNYAILILILLSGCSVSKQNLTVDEKIKHATNYAHIQLKHTVLNCRTTVLYPRATSENGKWETVQPKDWTSGFFPGCLWYMYRLTNDTSLRNAANLWTEGLNKQQFLTQTHDIGFIIFSSYGNGFKIDPSETYHEVLLQAARSLMKRYNPIVGCIKSWDGRKWDFPVIIDNMMNTELLFWASKNGGTKEMYDAAFDHSIKTMDNHFRNDGSTYHIVDYDTLTGKAKSKETHQGYATESVWARGQAWAVYGFTMAYRETNNLEFLYTAENAAVWFIDHLPKDKVPYWDFLVPDTSIEEKDVSAAAIASSALFELSSLSKNEKLKQKFYESAVKILSSLCSPPYLAEGTNSQGILIHAVGNHPKNSEINVSLIYADYYFLEAILRYQQTIKIY
jgi:unsaturated chondroitin disaccharide hydrolase